MHVVIDPPWINGPGVSDHLWLLRDVVLRLQRAPGAPTCLHPMRLSHDNAGQAPGLFAKSAASSRASTSPPLRRAPAECLAAWRRASMQRPQSDFGAGPPRPPPAAPAGSDADYVPGGVGPLRFAPAGRHRRSGRAARRLRGP